MIVPVEIDFGGKNLYSVYYIQSGEHGPVKIGRALRAENRILDLQTGNPERLQVILWLRGPDSDGGYKTERALHSRFVNQRIRGEWFRFAGPVARLYNDCLRIMRADLSIEEQRRAARMALKGKVSEYFFTPVVYRESPNLRRLADEGAA